MFIKTKNYYRFMATFPEYYLSTYVRIPSVNHLIFLNIGNKDIEYLKWDLISELGIHK